MARILDCHIHCSESKDDILIHYARINRLKYTLSELLQMMNENDVVNGLLLSPPLKTGRVLPNEQVIKLCEKSHDKLFPIITVEPSKSSVDHCVKLAKKNKGYVKGFKILLGYFSKYPYDLVYSKVYDYAEQQDLPVLFHTGDTATSTASLAHADPMGLDILANKRQEMKIIACHFGNPWLRETAEVLYKHQNVYADISGLFTIGAKYSNQYLEALSRALVESIYFIGNADKIIFGTDYPVERHPDAINFVQKLKINASDIEDIFSNNARRVFDI